MYPELKEFKQQMREAFDALDRLDTTVCDMVQLLPRSRLRALRPQADELVTVAEAIAKTIKRGSVD